MQKDQLLTRRRMLIAGAAALGAVGAGGLFSSGPGEESVPATAPAAGGPQARAALNKPSAYRLRPLTGDGAPRARPRKLAVRSEPILEMPADGRTMVLTFDDGPDPRYTPHILDTLDEYGVRAMFFVCGEMAVDNKELLARMADDGHIVGNHTWTHPLLIQCDRDQIRSEMMRTSDVIEDAYGERPEWFRAPYGAWNRATFQLGAEMGMEPLAWTVDSTDWTTPGTDTVVDRVQNGAAPGVIVLSHDAGGDRSQSVEALRRYLPFLLDNGYHLTVPRRRA